MTNPRKETWHDPGAQPIPAPFCSGRWREMLAGLGVMAAVIFGISVSGYVRDESGRPLTSNLRFQWRKGQHRSDAPLATAGRAPRPALAAVRQVALAASPVMRAATPGDGRLPATTRSAFTRAVSAIRPSVIGVRVTLAEPGVANAGRIGSGVVIDPAGYAVTCGHVVAGANGITATRFQAADRPLPTRLLAVEEDLALLQVVDSSPFPAAEFADSNRVAVGEWVLAVGHPFGLGLTVTAGIVGQRHASLTGPGGIQYRDLIQTDAPINEGSSGGPIVSLDGRILGLNAAIYSPTGVFSGAGFAIPSSRVRAFAQRVLGGVNGAPNAASWGFGAVELTPSLSASMGYPGARGVVVSSVVPDSPAQLARLSRGDIIIAIAGQRVDDLASMDRIRAQFRLDGAVSIDVWRQGRTETLQLQPGSARAASLARWGS